MSVQVGYGKQIVWFLLSIIIVLTVVEGSVRIYEFIFPTCNYLTSDAGKAIDLELRKKICDQSKSVKIIENSQHNYEPNQVHDTITINSFGFRGADFNETKDPNVFRILMVGGSTTFGAGSTSDNTTIPAFLQKEFLDDSYDVEVINAGVGGSSSIEEAYKIRHIYKKYQPDMFLVLTGWNDSFKHIENKELNPNISKKYFENTWSTFPSLQIWINETLQISRTINVASPFFSHHLISMTLNDEVYEKNSEIWSNRWASICEENNEDEIKTIIVLQPVVGTGTKQLSPSEKIHSDYIKPVKIREQLEFFSKTLPIESCSASLDFRSVFDNIHKPIYFDGVHTNDLGNKVIANQIYEKIIPVIKN